MQQGRYAVSITSVSLTPLSLMCRVGQIGELSVDFRQAVQDSSPGGATQLNFYSTSVVYLGEQSIK